MNRRGMKEKRDEREWNIKSKKSKKALTTDHCIHRQEVM